MENTMNDQTGRASIQIERPSLQVFSQADIDAMFAGGKRACEQDKEAGNGQG